MQCPCLSYFAKLPFSGKKNICLPKMVYGLAEDISCINFLVVNDFKTLFKWCKRSGHSESLWIAFQWGLHIGVFNTAIYGKNLWCSFHSFEHCIYLPKTKALICAFGFAYAGFLNITKTRPCNIQRFFTAVKMTIFSIIFRLFSYFCSKHILWVHVITASMRRF